MVANISEQQDSWPYSCCWQCRKEL